MEATSVTHMLMRGLNNMRLSGKLCDLTLVVEDSCIQLHRVVMAAASDLFASLISEQANVSVLHINGVKAAEMLTIVDFLYTGQMVLNHDNLSNMKSKAELLQLEPLTKFCEAFEKSKSQNTKLHKLFKLNAQRTAQQRHVTVPTSAQSCASSPSKPEPMKLLQQAKQNKKVNPCPKYSITDCTSAATDVKTSTEPVAGEVLNELSSVIQNTVPVGPCTDQESIVKELDTCANIALDSSAVGPSLTKPMNIVVVNDLSENTNVSEETSAMSSHGESTSLSEGVPGLDMSLMTEQTRFHDYCMMEDALSQAATMESDMDASELTHQMPDAKSSGKRKTTASKELVCPHCSRKYWRTQSLSNHIRRSHQQQILQCPTCNKTFLSQSLYNSHILVCLIGKKVEGRYQCPCCQYSMVRLDAVIQHYKLHHSKTVNTTCAQCGLSLSSHMLCKEHMLQVHNTKTYQKSKSYECTTCKFQTTRKKTLVQHVETHRSTKFSCAVCSRQFLHSASLRVHVQQAHGQNKFRCSLCNFESAQKASLLLHEYHKHGQVTTKKQLLYSCDSCAFTTVTMSVLRRHKAAKHSEAAPHLCSVCGKGFKTASYLRKHELTHSDVKQFKCSHCSYAAKTEPCLKSHVRWRHSDYMGYMCESCGYKTKHSSNLKTHQRRCKSKNDRTKLKPDMQDANKLQPMSDSLVDMQPSHHGQQIPLHFGDSGI